mmetsp:Transcript_77487/g.121943  ORF Transcript_77487/g.121943 Transcript_77487/m.121943 type:complete len:262 (+) Transcript_77487:79-864(+)
MCMKCPSIQFSFYGADVLLFSFGLLICAIVVFTTGYDVTICSESYHNGAWYGNHGGHFRNQFGTNCCYDDIQWVKFIYGLPFLLVSIFGFIASCFGVPLGLGTRLGNKCFLSSTIVFMSITAALAGICGIIAINWPRQTSGVCDIEPSATIGFFHDEVNDEVHDICGMNAKFLCDLTGVITAGGWLMVEITIFATIAYACGCSACCCCAEKWAEAKGEASKGPPSAIPAVVGMPVANQSCGQVVGPVVVTPQEEANPESNA